MALLILLPEPDKHGIHINTHIHTHTYMLRAAMRLLELAGTVYHFYLIYLFTQYLDAIVECVCCALFHQLIGNFLLYEFLVKDGSNDWGLKAEATTLMGVSMLADQLVEEGRPGPWNLSYSKGLKALTMVEMNLTCDRSNGLSQGLLDLESSVACHNLLLLIEFVIRSRSMIKYT